MKLEIKITRDVLQRSMNCSYISGKTISMNCAIAVAVRNLFPIAEVFLYAINFDGSDENLMLHSKDIYNSSTMSKLPKKASEFIRVFDGLRDTPEERLKLPEFSFEIDVPDTIIDQIGIQEAIDIINKSETLQLLEV